MKVINYMLFYELSQTCNEELFLSYCKAQKMHFEERVNTHFNNLAFI